MGEVVGSTGCNGLVGEYFRSADVMSFGELERTDAPCSPALQAQEAAILGVLDATSLSLQLPPDRLILTAHGSGDSLELSSASPLEGTTWLQSRLPEAPAPDSTMTLRLDAGRATGQGPCGSYSGSYASDGVFLTFADIVGSDDEECGMSRTEKALLAALRSTVMVDRARPELRLLDAAGRVLARFKDASRP
jgi:heat shock protein HslJ